MSWIGLHKFVDVLFGITQKAALYYTIKIGQKIHNKDFFWTCCVTWRATGH